MYLQQHLCYATLKMMQTLKEVSLLIDTIILLNFLLCDTFI